jgi:hypothetical protein
VLVVVEWIGKEEKRRGLAFFNRHPPSSGGPLTHFGMSVCVCSRDFLEPKPRHPVVKKSFKKVK